MRILVDGYQRKIFHQIWHSMLFAQKAALMAQSYLDGAVAFCQWVVNEVFPEAGIVFDPEMISQTIVGPPPGWNGDHHEPVDAVWWKDYLDQVLKAIPLQGPDSILYFEPLKEWGPSSSIDPDFLIDGEGQEEADYSRMFDTSPPYGQAADPLPQDGSCPSGPPAENIPESTSASDSLVTQS